MLFGFSGKAQTSCVHIGQVLFKDSLRPVAYALVKGNSNRYYICDSLGYFSFCAHQEDSLEFTHVAVQSKKVALYIITDTILFFLETEVNVMNEVVVMPNYNDLKKKMLAMKPADTVRTIFIPGVRTTPGHIEEKPPTIGNPLSLIAAALSKKEKEKRLYKKLMEQQFWINIYKQKYNVDLVSTVTALEGEKLDEFMLSYKPEMKFVLESNEYDLIIYIKECLKDFQQKSP